MDMLELCRQYITATNSLDKAGFTYIYTFESYIFSLCSNQMLETGMIDSNDYKILFKNYIKNGLTALPDFMKEKYREEGAV